MVEYSTRPKREVRDLYSTVVRTLLAAGYVITGTESHPNVLELDCERPSRLGALLKFRVAVTDEDKFDSTTRKAVNAAASATNRAAVFVSKRGGIGEVSRTEFLNVLGGAVPSWRALTAEYSAALITASKNQRPSGMAGEAWAAFENLVADGLDFCFGRRVTRMGGRRRGLRVSDIIAQLPDSSLLIVDTKAYTGGMNVTWPSLRALVEYVKVQQQYQHGRNTILAALLVSSGFKQNKNALTKPATDFLGETRIPLCFMEASTLSFTVKELTASSDFRNSVRWNLVFTGGLLTPAVVSKELKRSKTERFDSGED